MDVDSADDPPDGVRQLKKGPPSPLMATSLLEPHERALQFTHRFRLTGYSRLDFSGNSGYETDRGRKVGGTKEGGTKKGGMAPLLWCGFNGRVFSSRRHRSVSKGHCCWVPRHASTIWLRRACLDNAPDHLPGKSYRCYIPE